MNRKRQLAAVARISKLVFDCEDGVHFRCRFTDAEAKRRWQELLKIAVALDYAIRLELIEETGEDP